MADITTYFGEAVPATYPDGSPIIINGRPLLIPENYSLQQQADAAGVQAAQGSVEDVDDWFFEHFQPGGRGDPQRQTGWSGGFDTRFRDAGNYGYGMSAAAAGLGLDYALNSADRFNKFGTGKSLPAVNERAIRQGYGDFATRFLPVNKAAGQAYLDSVKESDRANRRSKIEIGFDDARDVVKRQFSTPDVQRYALKKWGDLNSPDAQAFMANFQRAFGGYPQHLDLDLLQPLPADGRIPGGKDVSLFVGRNGEVLVYARPPAPGGTGALRGIYGLDGGPNGSGSTGLNFFEDGTPRPSLVQPHPANSLDPSGGIDVTLANGAKEHWWSDPIDGFKRDRASPSPDNSSTFPDRFGNWAPLQSPGRPSPAPGVGNDRVPSQGRRMDGTSGASPFVSGAPAVPFVSAPDSPLAPAPPEQARRQSPLGSSTPATPDSVRVLSRQMAVPNGGGPARGSAPTPISGYSPEQTRRPPPEDRPLPFPVPPMVYGLPDPSTASGDDWFDRWIKPLLRP